jgi:hypothetical protein
VVRTSPPASIIIDGRYSATLGCGVPIDDTGLFGPASRVETANLLSSLQWYCEGNLPNLPASPPRLEGSASSPPDEAPLPPLSTGGVGPFVDLPLSSTSVLSTDIVPPAGSSRSSGNIRRPGVYIGAAPEAHYRAQEQAQEHAPEVAPRRGLRNAVVVVALLYPAGQLRFLMASRSNTAHGDGPVWVPGGKFEEEWDTEEVDTA